MVGIYRPSPAGPKKWTRTVSILGVDDSHAEADQGDNQRTQSIDEVNSLCAFPYPLCLRGKTALNYFSDAGTRRFHPGL